jgi:2-polyprenyl-3-methyl-5-hydroxy-6-metoxy-1,4-benzoquinol methylase
VASDTLWNHNIHYHPLIIAALPSDCYQVLDVGCGEGVLARELSGVARKVTAIDSDAQTIALAKTQNSAVNVDYVLDDFLVHPFEPQSFDAVVSVAALHHMDTSAALSQMKKLLRPGGTLAVVGLAQSRHAADLMFDLAGVVADASTKSPRPTGRLQRQRYGLPPRRIDKRAGQPGVSCRVRVIGAISSGVIP